MVKILELQKKVILSHWDADGIVSGYLLWKAFRFIPKRVLCPSNAFSYPFLDEYGNEIPLSSVLAVADIGNIFFHHLKGKKIFGFDHHEWECKLSPEQVLDNQFLFWNKDHVTSSLVFSSFF